MASTKKYKTLKGLVNQSGSQVTFENIKSGRFYHKNLGYINFTLSDEVEDKIYKQVAEVIGGRKPLKVRRGLRYTTSHWTYARFIYSKYTNSFCYCAGQDYTYEMNQLRKDLYN